MRTSHGLFRLLNVIILLSLSLNPVLALVPSVAPGPLTTSAATLRTSIPGGEAKARPVLLAPARAEPALPPPTYYITRATLAASGGEIASEAYTIRATVGQIDTPVRSGENYLVQGGVWTVADAAPTEVYTPTIQAEVAPGLALTGKVVTYTFTVANSGDQTMEDGVLVERLPEQLEFVEAGGAESVYDPETGELRWSLDPLGPGQEATLTLQARVIEHLVTLSSHKGTSVNRQRVTTAAEARFSKV